MNELIFNFGSIVNPKLMLREWGRNPQAKLNIFRIFNYLYKFSLERLSQFVNNEYLFLLLCVYLKTVKFTRIHGSPNMKKHRHAYYEACGKMLKCSQHSRKFDSVFHFDELLKVPETDETNKGNALQDIPATEADGLESEAELPKFDPQAN